MAFPSISTGIYRYPIEEAARVTVETVRGEAAMHRCIQEVVFCCFSADDSSVYERAITGS